MTRGTSSLVLALAVGCSGSGTHQHEDGGIDSGLDGGRDAGADARTDAGNPPVGLDCDDYAFRNDPVWTERGEAPDATFTGTHFLSSLLEQGETSAIELAGEGSFSCDYLKVADHLISRETDVAAAYARLGRTGTHEWDGALHHAAAIFGSWNGSNPYMEPTFAITGRVEGFLAAAHVADALGSAEMQRRYLHAAVRAALMLDEGRDMISEAAGAERRRYARQYDFTREGVWPQLGEDGRALTHANDLAWVGFVSQLRALYRATVDYGSPDERWRTAAIQLIRDYLANLDCSTVDGEIACGYYPHEYRDAEPDPARRDPRFLNSTPCNGTAEVIRALALALGADDGGRGLDLDETTRDQLREGLAHMVHSIDATRQGDEQSGYFWYQTERTGGAGGQYPGAYSVTAGGGSSGIAATLTAAAVALALPGEVSYGDEIALARSLADGALAFVESHRIEDAASGGNRWHVIQGCDPSRDPDGVESCGPTGTEWSDVNGGDYALVGKCRGVMPIAHALALVGIMTGSADDLGDVVGKSVTYVDWLTRTFDERYASRDGLPGLITPWSTRESDPPRLPTHLTNLDVIEALQAAYCNADPQSRACEYLDVARNLRLEVFKRSVAELRCQDQEEGAVSARLRPRASEADCTMVGFDP
ncbi:MAG: hypothetical protein HYY06_14100 [Deltaproteobacteria bacterium]|nr:hypothetical protein [Deltaproteobacteria bacterium]